MVRGGTGWGEVGRGGTGRGGVGKDGKRKGLLALVSLGQGHTKCVVVGRGVWRVGKGWGCSVSVFGK